MKKDLHSLQVGHTGFYEGTSCRVTDVIDELIIEVEGKFGKRFNWTFSYKSWFHKLLDVREWKLEEFDYDTKITISYYNLMCIAQVYQDRHKSCYTVILKGSPLDEHCETLLYEIEGTSWNDCMKKHHEKMGWETYKPLDEHPVCGYGK